MMSSIHNLRRPVTEREGAALERADDLHDAPVLEPDLIVEESSQLGREPGDGALGALARFHPIVMDAPELRVGRQSAHGGQGEGRVQHRAQGLLPLRGHEEVPERPEAASLVRIGDDIALPQDILQQLAFAALPRGDLLARAAVEVAEILFHFAEVREDFPGRGGHVLEALAQRRLVQEIELAVLDAGNLTIDLLFLPLEIAYPRGRVEAGALDELAQKLEHRAQPRLASDECSGCQALDPGDGLFGRGGQVEMGLVGPLGIIFSQPAARVLGPVVQIIRRGFREGLGPPRLPELVELVLEQGRQLRLLDAADVGLDERLVEKSHDQGSVIGVEQAPGGMVAAEVFQGAEVEVHRSDLSPKSAKR